MTSIPTTAADAATARRRSALPVLMAATFLIVLDFFVVNVALPSIQRELGASAGVVEWVVAGYGLGFATFLIIAGRLGDRFGRRRTFATGLTVFALTSAACGVAPSAAVLLPLVQGREQGWPAWTWGGLALGAAALAALAAHERRLARRGGAPLLEPALFAVRALRAGLAPS